MRSEKPASEILQQLRKAVAQLCRPRLWWMPSPAAKAREGRVRSNRRRAPTQRRCQGRVRDRQRNRCSDARIRQVARLLSGDDLRELLSGAILDNGNPRHGDKAECHILATGDADYEGVVVASPADKRGCGRREFWRVSLESW